MTIEQGKGNIMEQQKIKFLKIYANLPLKAREQVILRYNNEPLTWRGAYFEISSDSDDAALILKELEKLEFI